MGKEIQQTSLYTDQELVALNPYNPDILPDLENHVNHQVMTGSYSLDANLCLLRLYQFEPERMSTQIIARILIKALMAMPAPDLPLPLLDPGTCANGGAVQDIDSSLSLFGARFRQFWEEAAKNRHLLEAVPGFEQAIQSYAVHTLSLTYQRVPRRVVDEAINIEGFALDKFLELHVAECGWVLEKSSNGQSIVFPRNEFNHPELKKNAADSIQLEHITRIFPILG